MSKLDLVVILLSLVQLRQNYLNPVKLSQLSIRWRLEASGGEALNLWKKILETANRIYYKYIACNAKENT